MKEKYSNYILRRCVEGDVKTICELQRNVIESLEDKELLRENTREMFEHCIKDPNLSIGVFRGDELVAVAILVDEKNNKEDLSLNLVKYHVNNAANLKLVMIKKEYRGNGLQSALMWIIEKIAFNRGYTHLCTTVSPKNVHSTNNIKSAGYKYDHSAIKYEYLARDIYVKDIDINIASYNKHIIEIVSSLENKKNCNDLVLEGINFDRCFIGELDIVNTGDILEYEDVDSGNTYYGLVIKKFILMILIFIPEKKSLQIVDYADNINSLRLKKVWINTIGGLE